MTEYKFFVNDKPYCALKRKVCGLDIKVIASVDDPQQLYLEEDGQTGDRRIADRDFVDLREKPRRFYLAPSVIAGG